MWIQKRRPSVSLEILRDLSRLCKSLGGDLSTQLNQLVEENRLKELVEFHFDYSALSLLTNEQDIRYARQIQALFSKNESIDLGIDRDYVALGKFANSERDCFQTNRTLQYHRRKPSYRDSDVSSILHGASRKIGSILGAVPELEDVQFSFGPGANTNVKGAQACPRVKLSAALECSHELSPYVPEFLEETPAWTASHSLTPSTPERDAWVVNVKVVPGKLVFVPKDSKSSRSIIVEPLLNSFFQKGFGGYIRNRLLSVGVDLRDQTRNQSLAFEGSVSGNLATIDLSSASDCICSEIVWELLPYDWADVLSKLRTRHIKLPTGSESCGLPVECREDGSYPLEKFSSMGNGFTFELESLIFYGLAYAVCRHLHLSTQSVSVYGDDIIVPTRAFSLMEKTLSYCGFKFNQLKSFSEGPFRESCGADFYKGFDIRPFYVREGVSDRTLFLMHNWFLRRGECELATLVKARCTQSLIIYGPDGYGDGHLIGSHLLRRGRKVIRSGWEGGYFDTYSLRPCSFSKLMSGDCVLPVYSVYTRSGKDDPTDPNVVRGSRGYAKVSIYTLSGFVFRR